MSTENRTKINKLLSEQPNGVVLLSSWLTKQGYNLNLQKRYKSTKWLQSIGTGAMIRFGDQVGYEGAVYALQEQLGTTIHPGGKTALLIAGKTHYLSFSEQKITLFGSKGEKLPTWFKQYDMGVIVDFYNTAFLPLDLGIKNVEIDKFTIKVSGTARAMMECLYLVPQKQELLECYEIMEGLNNLRPDLVQKLLEQCNSVKVKRLFMYLAEKAGHDWFNYLNEERINLGAGKRSIIKNGAFDKKYKITIPKELAIHGK